MDNRRSQLSEENYHIVEAAYERVATFIPVHWNSKVLQSVVDVCRETAERTDIAIRNNNATGVKQLAFAEVEAISQCLDQLEEKEREQLAHNPTMPAIKGDTTTSLQQEIEVLQQQIKNLRLAYKQSSESHNVFYTAIYDAVHSFHTKVLPEDAFRANSCCFGVGVVVGFFVLMLCVLLWSGVRSLFSSATFSAKLPEGVSAKNVLTAEAILVGVQNDRWYYWVQHGVFPASFVFLVLYGFYHRWCDLDAKIESISHLAVSPKNVFGWIITATGYEEAAQEGIHLVWGGLFEGAYLLLVLGVIGSTVSFFKGNGWNPWHACGLGIIFHNTYRQEELEDITAYFYKAEALHTRFLAGKDDKKEFPELLEGDVMQSPIITRHSSQPRVENGSPEAKPRELVM